MLLLMVNHISVDNLTQALHGRGSSVSKGCAALEQFRWECRDLAVDNLASYTQADYPKGLPPGYVLSLEAVINRVQSAEHVSIRSSFEVY